MIKHSMQIVGTLIALGVAAVVFGNRLEFPFAINENKGTPATTNSPFPSDAEFYRAGAAPVINQFNLDEITGGGCGMTLRRAERNPQDRQYVLFNGLEQRDLHNFDVRMEMKINDEIVQFTRTDYDGDEFAVEQYPFQSFVSQDGTLMVDVNVDVLPSQPPELLSPASGETSVVQIIGGTIVVSQDDQQTRISVQGDAGC